jgi:hypothetical protein
MVPRLSCSLLYALLEMVMEIYTFMGNLPRIGCAALLKAWGKKSHK